MSIAMRRKSFFLYLFAALCISVNAEKVWSQGFFTPTDDLVYGRYNYTATLLSDNKVLFSGGTNSSMGFISFAEIYNPDTETFTATTGSMGVARASFTATLLNDGSGRVLVTGGEGVLSSAELYNPGSDTFDPTGSMGQPLHAHTATLLTDGPEQSNGKVLVAGKISGGNLGAYAALYNPNSEMFEPTSFPTTPRFHAEAVLIRDSGVQGIDGQVLMVGGDDGGGGYFASAELYNPATGMFDPIGSMTEARSIFTATLFPNPDNPDELLVLIAGGRNNGGALSSAEIYDPQTGMFTPTTQPMNVARYNHAASLVDGKVLIVGGRTNNGDGTFSTVSSAEIYDPQTGMFTPTGSMVVTARGDFSAITLSDGRVLVAGGDNGAVSQDSAELYEFTLPNTTLSTVQDSFLRGGNRNRNEGANPRLRIQGTGNNRVVVGFDLTGIDISSVTQATLILTIAENANNWGSNNDRTVDAHPLLTDFTEGNGKSAGLPSSESTRGNGPGVTWNCASDDDISNQQPNCDPEWDGGDFGPATAAPIIHSNALLDAVEWDVTSDVLAGSTGWVIKKTNEGQAGKVFYYSREGAAEAGDLDLAPQLILEFQ